MVPLILEAAQGASAGFGILPVRRNAAHAQESILPLHHLKAEVVSKEEFPDYCIKPFRLLDIG